MENPKESKGKVVIKPRPPKGMVEEAPLNAIGPEEACDMAPIQPCAQTPPPTPEVPEAPVPEEAPAPKPAKKCNKKCNKK